SFLPAQIYQAFLIVSDEGKKVLEEVVKRAPDDIYAHYYLGLYYQKDSNPGAAEHFEKAEELCIQQKDADTLCHIAQIRNRPHLSSTIYELLDSLSLSRDDLRSYLEAICALDPTHVPARRDLLFQVYDHPQSKEHIQAILLSAATRADRLASISLLCIMRGKLKIFELCGSGLSEEDKDILTNSSHTPSLAEMFIKYGLDVRAIVRVWSNYSGSLGQLYDYLSDNKLLPELQEELVEILIKKDSRDDKKFRLNRLCADIEKGDRQEDLSERIQEHIARAAYVQRRDEDILLIANLLRRKLLLPTLRKKILEVMIAEQHNYRGAEENVDKARMCLAEEYLTQDRDAARATPLIKMQMERLLRGSNIDLMDNCLLILTNYKILPEARKRLLERRIELTESEKARSDNADRKKELDDGLEQLMMLLNKLTITS
ncbi:MAG: hypothetical protein JSR46_09010, partial [Verrucomicrobia bacterium]|nr:hypothetical protein [Verrucomicrobiota bacterium]